LLFGDLIVVVVVVAGFKIRFKPELTLAVVVVVVVDNDDDTNKLHSAVNSPRLFIDCRRCAGIVKLRLHGSYTTGCIV